MSKPTTTAIVISAALLLAPWLLGCRGAAEERATAARAREWAALQQAKRELDAARHELQRLRARLASAPVSAEGTPVAAADVALAAEVENRSQRLRARSAQLGERLVRHIAGFERGADERAETPPALAAAIRLKSDEDVEVAQEWIDRGGDYRRAIEILETQRHVDPDSPRLEQALARAREMRFVTAERLARVEAGMSPIDVRAALGPVNLREVLRRPAERLEAWYYPKAGGGKAAVYFRYDPGRRGFVVYQTELAVTARPRQAPAALVG